MTLDSACCLVQPLGAIENTAPRRITCAAALEFGEVHAEVYREHGFDLYEVPVDEPVARAATVLARVGEDFAADGSLVSDG